MKIVLGLLVAFTFTAAAQVQLPDGPGKEETQRVCKGCHEVERSVSKRQDRDGWRTTIEKMVGLGAKVSQKDQDAVLDYLAKNYPADDVPKVNVNTASGIQLESGLTLRR